MHASPSDVFDPAEASRVVASVVLAAPVTQAVIQQANHGLVRLSLNPLSGRDSVVSTPEELAPLVPPKLRDARAHAAPVPVVDPLRARIARVQAEMNAVIQAVNTVVIGKSSVVTRVIVAMVARGHVLLVDVPGVGKTLLCK